jgi:hypothetical protein
MRAPKLGRQEVTADTWLRQLGSLALHDCQAVSCPRPGPARFACKLQISSNKVRLQWRPQATMRGTCWSCRTACCRAHKGWHGCVCACARVRVAAFLQICVPYADLQRRAVLSGTSTRSWACSIPPFVRGGKWSNQSAQGTVHAVTVQVAHMERAAQTTKVRTELMLKELSALPDDTRMYKSVGKA